MSRTGREGKSEYCCCVLFTYRWDMSGSQYFESRGRICLVTVVVEMSLSSRINN